MEVKFNTLTPLWTGGVETGKVWRLRETGFLGGLRWWYEVLVRSMGGEVNDPTDKLKKGLDVDKYSSLSGEQRRDSKYLRNAGLCDVSQVFGATNWRRRFRLEIDDATQHDQSISDIIELRGYSYPKGNGKKIPTWWFPEKEGDKPRSGCLTIRVVPLADNFDPEIIMGLLQFIADWAALGARAQMGFGVVEPVNDRLNTRPLYEHLSAINGSKTYPSLPSLNNIFFAQINPKNKLCFTEEDTFVLKHILRQKFTNKKIRHFVMGTVSGDKIASKVKISRPYPYGDEKFIRLWGWLPENFEEAPEHYNRESCRDIIYQHISSNYNLVEWKELHPPKPISPPRDSKDFLRKLLEIVE